MNSLRYITSRTSEDPSNPPQPSYITKLFSKLFPFTSKPPPPPPKKRKSKVERSNSVSAFLPSLPKLFITPERKLLVLDLDETLVHSMTRGASNPSHIVEVHLKEMPMSSFYYVFQRPHCMDFLHSVAQWFELAIFTASVQEYADPIIDLLEREFGSKVFKKRYYRHDCIKHDEGTYVKDLSIIGEDLRRVMLIDNSPESLGIYEQKNNGIPIEGWVLDPSDRALIQLLPLLFALRHATDVRSILGLQNGRLLSTSRAPERPDGPTSPGGPSGGSLRDIPADTSAIIA